MALKVSEAWLAQHAKAESRVEFHGPQIALPVRKAINELSWYQRLKLRREREDARRTA